MTKKEFLEKALHEARGAERAITGVDTEAVWDACCKIIREELLANGEIAIQGVGKLKVRETAKRRARNPKTGEEIEVSAGRRVVFAPGAGFREELKKLAPVWAQIPVE